MCNPEADNTKTAHLKEPPPVLCVQEQTQHTPATDESTPNVEKATLSEAQQQHATASAETESMQKTPQKSNVEAQEETLSKQGQAMQVQESKNLQVILTVITYSPLWQVIYAKPRKHWTVRGLTTKDMKKAVNKLLKIVAKHQNWKGPHGGRELDSRAWQHCINECLAREDHVLQLFGEAKLDQALGLIVRMAKTDPHTLENQKPTKRRSNTVDLDPQDVVHMAYHAIVGLMGNVWKETEHMLEQSQRGTAAPHKAPIPSATTATTANASSPQTNTLNPYLPPHRRNRQLVQKHRTYLELNLWAPVPHPNPE